MVTPITAALEDTYTAPPHPFSPATDATFTIEAPLCILFAAARIQRIVPFWFVSMIRSRSSSVKRSIGFNPASRIPALLTRISILPYFSIAASINLSGSSGLEISVDNASTSPPACLISSAISSNAAALLAVITTDAPSAANNFAVAAPTPELPPVMTATFPVKRPIFCSSFIFERNFSIENYTTQTRFLQ